MILMISEEMMIDLDPIMWKIKIEDRLKSYSSTAVLIKDFIIQKDDIEINMMIEEKEEIFNIIGINL